MAPDASASLRWLYIDFNSYFASVEQQLRPELRGKPIAIVAVETDSTCAIAASYEAKAYGIKTGTPIYEAKKICPDLQIVLARHEQYVDYHHRIRQEVENHIPVSAVCSIDEVACRLMNNENSVERATAIAASIKKGLASNVGEYVRCSIGIAPNRYLAKVATELQKPDGLVVLQQADLPHRLYGLKLRDIPGIGRNMELRLQAAGVMDMKTLLHLNQRQMLQLWGGVWGERMYFYLRGVDLPEPATNRSSIGHSHVMAPELRDPKQAQFVARRLLLKAASRLRRMGYYAGSFSLAARLESGPRLEIGTRCEPAQDNATFLSFMNEGWKEIERKAGNNRIKKLSVTLSGLTAEGARQPELFDLLPTHNLKRRQKAEKLSHAMDRINHKFGRDSVLLGMLPSQGRTFSGTKIAFTRIPDQEEFLE